MNDRRLDAIRRLKYLLDEAFRVPGTSIRFGWDPIIGLLPWVGDLATALLSCAIIVQAHLMGLPKIVQLRMLINVGIDLLVGVVPVLGDAADVVWRSNSRNFALLERHAARPHAASLGDWLFVAGVLASVVALALVPLLVVYWLVHLLVAHGLLR